MQSHLSSRIKCCTSYLMPTGGANSLTSAAGMEPRVWPNLMNAGMQLTMLGLGLTNTQGASSSHSSHTSFCFHNLLSSFSSLQFIPACFQLTCLKYVCSLLHVGFIYCGRTRISYFSHLFCSLSLSL